MGPNYKSKQAMFSSTYKVPNIILFAIPITNHSYHPGFTMHTYIVTYLFYVYM